MNNETKWQTIETAPKDGRKFIGWHPRYGYIVSEWEPLRGSRWPGDRFYPEQNITLWQELPAPPQENQDD